MAEYLANAVQTVPIGSPILLSASIPCNRGYVFHEDETGIFILRGITPNCFARYQVTYNGNIAIPADGAIGPIAVSMAVNGEERPTSKAIVTPTDTEAFFNVTSTAIVTVPRNCCFSLSVRAVAADPTATTTAIDVQDSNLTINRIA